MSIPNDKQVPGTKIRVSITGTVRDDTYNSDDKPLSSLTPVSGRSNHFLYLISTQVTGDKRPGGRVTATFDAEITSPAKAGSLGTTRVRELSGNGTLLYTHYVYLDSPEVTLLPDDEPAPAAAVTIGAGRTSEPGTETGKRAGMTSTKVTSFDQLRPGDRVTIEAFTGNVESNGVSKSSPLNSLVRIGDPDTGNVHWFPAELLTRPVPPVPFKDDIQYADVNGEIWTFRGGQWLGYPKNTDRYNFSYPPRPMREVTVGAEISE